jgi:hypothetical protein
MGFRHFKLLFGILLFCTAASGQTSLTTMSQVNNFIDDVVFRSLLEVDINKAEAINLAEKKCFLPMLNYIDYNILGVGHTVALDGNKMVGYIAQQVNAGVTENEFSEKLLHALVNKEFYFNADSTSHETSEKTKVNLGGFFVTEFEYHQEPDGVYHPLLEINQTRIYVSAELNKGDSKNKVSFLGEWNPLPEEVIHQIDEITFRMDTATVVITSPGPDAVGMHGQVSEEINFERLYVRIENVANSNINLTVGQFRNPFGVWSDYTSHRNFTTTKNNQLVNGFALKKIELGAKLDMKLKNGFEWQAAIMHGRLTRTSGLTRDDSDDRKDFCGRAGYERNRFSIGASFYLAEFNTNRIAAGVDYLFHTSKISVSGEFVYQRNSTPQEIFDVPESIDNLSSYSGYLQVDFLLSQRMHIYGLYEAWDYRVNDKQVYDPAGKIFHGLRYSINNNLRWTILEYGHMFHKNYDKGETHLSTQLELVF